MKSVFGRGIEAYFNGCARLPPPLSSDNQTQWWLAGWDAGEARMAVSPDQRPAMTEDDGPQTPYRPQSLLPDVNPPLPTTGVETTALRCGCSVKAHSSLEVSECFHRRAFYQTQVAYNQAGQQLGKAAEQARPTKRIAELEMENRILQQQLDVAKAECARLTALLPPVEKKVDPWANALRWSR